MATYCPLDALAPGDIAAPTIAATVNPADVAAPNNATAQSAAEISAPIVTPSNAAGIVAAPNNATAEPSQAIATPNNSTALAPDDMDAPNITQVITPDDIAAPIDTATVVAATVAAPTVTATEPVQSVAAPNNATSQPVNEILAPTVKAPTAAAVVSTPNATQAESAATVAAPNNATAAPTQSTAAPNVTTATATGVVSAPNITSSVAANNIDAPTIKTSEPVEVIDAPVATDVVAVNDIAAPITTATVADSDIAAPTNKPIVAPTIINPPFTLSALPPSNMPPMDGGGGYFVTFIRPTGTPKLYVINPQDSFAETDAPAAPLDARNISTSEELDMVSFAGTSGAYRVRSITDDQLLLSGNIAHNALRAILSPATNELIVIHSGSNGVTKIPLDGSATTTYLPALAGTVNGGVITSDGQYAILTGTTFRVACINLTTGAIAGTNTNPTTAIFASSSSVSPDNQRVAFCSEGDNYICTIPNLTEINSSFFAGTFATYFSPTNNVFWRSLFFDSIFKLDATTLGEIASRNLGRSTIRSIIESPDGSLLYVTHDGGSRASILDAETLNDVFIAFPFSSGSPGPLALLPQNYRSGI